MSINEATEKQLMNHERAVAAVEALYPASDVRRAGFYEDTNLHFDIVARGRKLDIKGAKTPPHMQIIEFIDNNGRPGWIHGEADAVCFATAWGRIFEVSRAELRDFTVSRANWSAEVVDTSVDGGAELHIKPYRIYGRSRFGNEDRFCYVPIADLMTLDSFKWLV